MTLYRFYHLQKKIASMLGLIHAHASTECAAEQHDSSVLTMISAGTPVLIAILARSPLKMVLPEAQLPMRA